MREEHEERRPDRETESKPSTESSPGPGRPEYDQAVASMRRARQARVAKVLAALAIAIVLIVFIIANSQPVKVNFVFLTRHPRLIWVMFACTVLGGLAGYLIGKPGKQVRMPGRHREPQKDGSDRQPR